MNRLLDIFSTQFRVSLAVQFQYRASMFIWLIGAILQPVIFLSVWNAVAGVQGGSVGGYTAADFAAYFIVLMLVDQWTFSWIMWEYEYQIRDGTLARKLMRPVHPVVSDVADNIAYKMLTSIAIIPAAIVLTAFFHPNFQVTALHLLLFAPAVVLAFVLRFTLDWLLAMAAFWTTRVMAINQLYFIVMLFFSGQVAPLSLMPPAVQVIAALLPFRWMIAFPVSLVLGQLSAQEIALGFAAQVIWIGVAVSLMAVVWRAGVKQFAAVGS